MLWTVTSAAPAISSRGTAACGAGENSSTSICPNLSVAAWSARRSASRSRMSAAKPCAVMPSWSSWAARVARVVWVRAMRATSKPWCPKTRAIRQSEAGAGADDRDGGHRWCSCRGSGRARHGEAAAGRPWGGPGFGSPGPPRAGQLVVVRAILPSVPRCAYPRPQPGLAVI